MPSRKELREHAEQNKSEAKRLLNAALNLPEGTENLAVNKAVDYIIAAAVLEVELMLEIVKHKPLK